MMIFLEPKSLSFLFRHLRRGVVFFLIGGFTFSLVAAEPIGEAEERLNRIEWRGVMAFPGEVRFSLHTPGAETGPFWIGLGETRRGVEAIEYDREEERLTLRHGEVTRTFSMSSSTIVALHLDAAARERLSRLWQEAVEASTDLAETDETLRRANEAVRTLARVMELHRELVRAIPETEDLPEPTTREEAMEIELIRRERETHQGILTSREGRLASAVEDRRHLEQKALTELRALAGITPQARRELEAGVRAGFLLGLETRPEQE